MTFPFRRNIEFYSSKTKLQLLEEVQKMVFDETYVKAESESFTGDFVIRTAKRFLFFNIVFCGILYEVEGRTIVIITAKMRLFVEILLLAAIGTAASGSLSLLADHDAYAFGFIIGSLFLCGLFWAINYLQFKPALNSLKAILS
jgi:hypothetical protein